MTTAACVGCGRPMSNGRAECADCSLDGDDLEWIECDVCDGDGEVHDCGEDTCSCLDPTEQDVWECTECDGHGGWRGRP